MLALTIAACLFIPPPQLHILFLGNSHTASNDVPGMVRQMLETDGSKRTVTTRMIIHGFLEDQAQNVATRRELASGTWDVVVLQGAKLSSSHKFKYPHDGAIEIAKLAKRSGARVLIYAEWPRKGWAERDYILDEYGQIAKAAKVDIVPIPIVWDRVLYRKPELPMWSSDGNHAAPLGSYLAAVCLYFAIDGNRKPIPTWRPAFANAATASLIGTEARAVDLISE
ncbi:MAG: hypothetical protein ACAH95_00330 [Fimbriimonas sp.]